MPTYEKPKYNNFAGNIFRYKKSGYLKYFHEVVGNKLYFSFTASVIMTFLDSVGIGLILAILQVIVNPDQLHNNTIINRINGLLNNIGLGDINIFGMLIIAIGLFLFKGIMSYFQMYLQANITSKIISNTRRSMVTSLQEMNYIRFITTDIGTIHNISTIEVSRLNNALHNYLNTMQYVIMSFCYVTIAIITNFKFALIVFISAGILLYFYNFLIVYFKKLSAEISIKGNLYNSYLSQLLNNYKYLKTTNAIEGYSKKVLKEIDDSEKISLKFWRINALTNSAREPIILLIAGIVIIFYYQWTGHISSVIIYSILLFYRTLNYILLAQSNWQSFHQYSGSIDNIIDTQQRLNDSKEDTKENEFGYLKDKIEIKDVSVKINDQAILSKVNFTINKNTTTALVGKSGAGKSTLASVISGLISVSEGQILLDGIDLASMDLNSYRNHIGYVSQDAVIFNESVYNNVTLWDQNSEENQDRFRQIIKLVKLETLINDYPEKEHTIVGDNGIILSGGQKQRISIARELYKNTEIIILDEATSSLDSSTENLISENLRDLNGRMTFIIIAHRLSTIRNADQIILLENGSISDTGKFNELSTRSQSFKNMVQLQNTGHGNL